MDDKGFYKLLKFCDNNDLSFDCHYHDGEFELEIIDNGLSDKSVRSYFKKVSRIDNAIEYFIKEHSNLKWIR